MSIGPNFGNILWESEPISDICEAHFLKINRGFLNFLAVLLLSMTFSCNHLFYFPDDLVYTTPDKLNLKYQNISIMTTDSTTLHGWWIQSKPSPKNSNPSNIHEPLGTILQFHGNAQNMTAHFVYLAWLVPLGFDLVVFDYRGYGKSKGEPTRDGLILDGLAVMNWVRTHARSKDLVVIGQSLGGAVAIPTIAQTGTTGIKALVIDSSFASYREVAQLKLGDIWLTWPFQYPLSYLVTDNHSPQDSVQTITIPKLFIHAIGDPVVPYSTGRALYEAANPPKEFWTIPVGGVGDGHTGAFGDQNPFYRKRLVSYLCDQLNLKECP